MAIGGGDVTEGMGVFRYGDREGSVDEGSIVYGCQRALILVAGGALWAMSWVDECICILKTIREAESWDYGGIEQIQFKVS